MKTLKANRREKLQPFPTVASKHDRLLFLLPHYPSDRVRLQRTVIAQVLEKSLLLKVAATPLPRARTKPQFVRTRSV